MKSDWSGEHVKVQKVLKKLSLQAGHDEMIWLAVDREDLSALTCGEDG
jgi:hypothetical protein